jgi:hypothetical protein
MRGLEFQKKREHKFFFEKTKRQIVFWNRKYICFSLTPVSQIVILFNNLQPSINIVYPHIFTPFKPLAKTPESYARFSGHGMLVMLVEVVLRGRRSVTEDALFKPGFIQKILWIICRCAGADLGMRIWNRQFNKTHVPVHKTHSANVIKMTMASKRHSMTRVVRPLQEISDSKP